MGIGSLGGTVFFQVGLCIPLQIMNNLYVNPTDLFNDIFLVYKVRWMERNQLLDWLWHIWFKSDSVKTKKQKKQTVQHSKVASMTTRWMRGRNQAQGRKIGTHWQIQIIFTQESIPCTNFCACVTPFVCMLCACSHNHAYNLWRPVYQNFYV